MFFLVKALCYLLLSYSNFNTHVKKLQLDLDLCCSFTLTRSNKLKDSKSSLAVVSFTTFKN